VRRWLLPIAMIGLSVPALAGDVSVSLNIAQPGFFGQVEIGSHIPAAVIYPQAVVAVPAREYESAPPVYLRVPPGHEKHWSKHCGEYNACGRRVYFVRHDWYENEYAPRHRHDDGERGDRDVERGRGHEKHRGRDGEDR
jgi:hypothetical protein